MIRIAYDADALFIEGVKTPMPAGTLVASRDGDIITIASLHGTQPIVAQRFDGIADATGAGFGSAADCLAYLVGEFAKRPVADRLVSRFTAGAALGGHRIVATIAPDVVAYASSDDTATAGTIVGLTLGAALPGAPIDVVTAGPVDEPTWALQPGPVYLGLDGALTQASAATGFDLRIGTALAATKLLVEIQEPFFLAT